ncbi:MAG: prepilin-type N-terminal cleavage/methylation domain-containing protein [Candidatus Babeliales bacterium]
MHKHAQSGFTLAEVMMAVTVAGVMISSIFFLATQVYKQTAHCSNALYDVYAYRDIAEHAALERVQKQKKEKPSTTPQTIVTTFKAVPKESALGAFRDIKRETIVHKEGTHDALVTFVWMPEVEDKE